MADCGRGHPESVVRVAEEPVNVRGALRRATGWLTSALLLAGEMGSAVGCAGAVEAKAPAPSEAGASRSVARLLPLEHDTVLSYETTSDTGDQGILILQVRRPREGLVELDVAGRVQRLDVDESSVMHATGGYLLKEPIVAGATFRGAFGEVRVTTIEKSIRVPAGTFHSCVETIEESKVPFKRATSVYCPEVGLVSLVVEANGADGDMLRVESRLKSYGPRVILKSLR